jgi:alpha-galactosidase
MKFPLLLAMAAVAVTSLRADAPPAPAKPAMSLDIWNATLPFSFKYDGKDASTFLSTWQKSEEPATPSEGGQTHHYVFTDPATKLKVTADVRTFTDFAAVDWVLHFTNSGSADTPILEDVQPLAWDAPEKCNDPVLVTHYGNAGGESLTAGERGFGTKQPMKFSSAYGYSSHGTLPYFNLCDANYNGQFAAKGPGGIMFVIGWTGNWTSILTWDREDKTMNLRAGMNATHLLLHPGESIRTPRIVMLPWQGDYIESNNLWRRLVLGFYSPKDSTGHPVTMPVALFTGPETIDAKLAAVQALHDKKIPVDLYLASGWAKVRGTWTPDPAAYPNGLKPLGDALKQAGIGFALAAEPESADPGSDLLTQHPDWFFPTAKPKTPALLNLGNPAARKAITELISGLITSSGATWYHHDLSQQPQESWAAGDTPDRVGISQINYITGLYQFWDDLRARHPGLIIDSTANGGNRLDIEAISRTTGLWRSDPYEPFVEQIETQELTPWVPLNSGNLGGINPPSSIPSAAPTAPAGPSPPNSLPTTSCARPWGSSTTCAPSFRAIFIRSAPTAANPTRGPSGRCIVPT